MLTGLGNAGLGGSEEKVTLGQLSLSLLWVRPLYKTGSVHAFSMGIKIFRQGTECEGAEGRVDGFYVITHKGEEITS